MHPLGSTMGEGMQRLILSEKLPASPCAKHVLTAEAPPRSQPKARCRRKRQLGGTPSPGGCSFFNADAAATAKCQRHVQGCSRDSQTIQ